MPYLVSIVKAFVGEQKIVTGEMTIVVLVKSDVPSYSVRAQKISSFSFSRVTNQERQRQREKISFLRFLLISHLIGEKYKDFWRKQTTLGFLPTKYPLNISQKNNGDLWHWVTSFY